MTLAVLSGMAAGASVAGGFAAAPTAFQVEALLAAALITALNAGFSALPPPGDAHKKVSA
ncbi:hypothetical protein ACFVYA_00260 [Amycolatopsis sp. NPDC058278]|uniref:hypothetical protein n=1 Tax=Amycolatopsis sp. NPDC058278 TaxID=3346417 RepID=UPI0036D8287A